MFSHYAKKKCYACRGFVPEIFFFIQFREPKINVRSLKYFRRYRGRTTSRRRMHLEIRSEVRKDICEGAVQHQQTHHCSPQLMGAFAH